MCSIDSRNSASLLVAASFLLGVPNAQAQTVIFSGSTASGIRDLNVNGVLYDVDFRFASAMDVYGNPPVFDFTDRGAGRPASLPLLKWHRVFLHGK